MFTLAHLSDPHIGPILTPPLRELTNKRGLGLINWYRKRHRHHSVDVLHEIVRDLQAQSPGHIAVTGDLVNVSLDTEFARAARWLGEVGAPRDVTLTPGNHDAYIRRAAGHAAEHWGDYMRGDDGAAFPFVRRRGPLALIGLSTAAPTAPFLATGRLGREQIARLPEALDRSNREGLFRVVLIHHPPISKPARYLKRLLDGADFRAALARHGAELVIHGHDHAHSLIELEGPQRRIPVVGAPSASEARGKHCAGYNLYRVEGRNGQWRCEAVWRSLARDGDAIVEIKRTILSD